MRCAHITPEGIDDLKRRGFRVQRLRSGGFSVSESPAPPRLARAARKGPGPLARVAALWERLDSETFHEWEAYAWPMHHKRPQPGGPMPTYNAFVKVMTAALAEGPDAEPSLRPPFPPFGPDKLLVSVEALPGLLVVRGTYRNRTGVQTEVLARPLDGEGAPTGAEPFAVCRGAFHNGRLERRVALAAGRYEIATRFVETATGRTTPPETLGAVEIATPARPFPKGEGV